MPDQQALTVDFVTLELAGRDAGLEEVVELEERAVAGLGKEEVDPEDALRL